MKVIKSIGKLLAAFSIITLLFSGCQKEAASRNSGSKPGTPGNIPGMGNASGELTGTAFFFPQEVEIRGGIRGAAFDYPDKKDYCKVAGSGRYVLLNLSLVNHTGKDTTLIIPGGLTFKAHRAGDQNGIVLRETSIRMVKDEICEIALLAYCLNKAKAGSSPASSYSFGPVTDAAPIAELTSLLTKKRVNYEELERADAIDLMLDLQEILWKITDGKGMDSDDREYLRALDEQ